MCIFASPSGSERYADGWVVEGCYWDIETMVGLKSHTHTHMNVFLVVAKLACMRWCSSWCVHYIKCIRVATGESRTKSNRLHLFRNHASCTLVLISPPPPPPGNTTNRHTHTHTLSLHKATSVIYTNQRNTKPTRIIRSMGWLSIDCGFSVRDAFLYIDWSDRLFRICIALWMCLGLNTNTSQFRRRNVDTRRQCRWPDHQYNTALVE